VKDIYLDKVKDNSTKWVKGVAIVGASISFGLIVYMIYKSMNDETTVSSNINTKLTELDDIRKKQKLNAPNQEILKVEEEDLKKDIKLEKEIIEKKIEQISN
jgi:uncharacterized protein HemX